VECRLVIRVKSGKKVIPEVPNAPVATRVNLALVPVARVNNALLVNRGRRPMM
jgi:hypothetical protein